ncbi:hypothetical protein BLNAU_21791 [Blattamonas nauphoetae]|uniref:Uncharacterized protein n=1 Tax=Blattamonas nauphoetae TaxID=2049346 RepID=A0ABQ9WW20_9EUKA|nr:hypothetical protein BLNAU_21791 [Blattamonas nauphoetae]
MSIHTCLSSFASVSNRQTIPVTNTQLASLTGLAAAKIAEICFTPLHLSLLRLICFSAVDFGSDMTFVGSAIHFAYTLLSQPLSSHSFEGCDAKEQPCIMRTLFQEHCNAPKKTSRQGKRKGGRGKTEYVAELSEETPSATWHALRQTSPASPHHTRRAHSKGGDCDWGRKPATKEGGGGGGGQRLRRKETQRPQTENREQRHFEMLTEILMAPTVQTVAIKKQRDLSLVATRTIQKCFDGLLLKAIVDSELEKREASPELDTTSNT